MSQQIICLVAQQKGGTGKTTYTDFLHSTCLAANKEVLVIDVDDGNSGFIRRAGKEAAVPLSWSTPASSAAAWIMRHLAGKEVALFDLGANLFASGAPVTEFLAEMVTHLQATGARIIFFAVAAPNSPGCDRLVAAMRNDFGALGEVRVVENNVDGSGSFPKTITTLGMPRIVLPHIDPGIQSVRLLRAEPLLELLRRPPEGYGLAMARYAQFVLEFAQQETVLDIVGEGALSGLRQLASSNPSEIRFVLRTLAAANDQSINANVEYGRAYRALRSVTKSDPDEVYVRAIKFIEASKLLFGN